MHTPMVSFEAGRMKALQALRVSCHGLGACPIVVSCVFHFTCILQGLNVISLVVLLVHQGCYSQAVASPMFKGIPWTTVNVDESVASSLWGTEFCVSCFLKLVNLHWNRDCCLISCGVAPVLLAVMHWSGDGYF